MATAYELDQLPSPSAFSPDMESPTKKSKRPELFIKTSFRRSSSASKDTTTATAVEREGQELRAEPAPERIERRRTNHRKRERFPMKSSERGYSQVPGEESDYYTTTPTTLNSLEDLDAISPVSSRHHRNQSLHQKSVSRFRLKLLYTIIPVFSLIMFALYTFIIIDHTQKKMLRKIQYPGTGGIALAQVASGPGLSRPQNLLGGGAGSATTETVAGSETVKEENTGSGAAESEKVAELPQGLGPIKTGIDGADTNIGGLGNGMGKPEGWKGVPMPDSDEQNAKGGPTILVPTGASITITNETPVPQIVPPPPPKQYTLPSSSSQTTPAVTPDSSIKIPGYPYPLSCGPTPATARAQNCVFDIMSYAWLPPPCYDHNLTTEFINLKARSISLTPGNGRKSQGGESKTEEKEKEQQTLTTGWRYYASYTDPTPLSPNIVEAGDVPQVYVTWEWHREHCLFMWRKLHRSLLVYGGGGDVLGDEGAVAMEKGKEMMVDGYIGDYGHTMKCGESLRGGDGIDGQAVNTLIKMKFPECGVMATAAR